MQKIELLKSAVKFVIGVGVSKIVNDIIENNVDTEHTYQKVSVKVASVGIGGAVATAAGNYTDRQIDDIVELVQKIKNRKNETTTED